MFSNIFDTHAHYDDEKFDGDRDEILSALPSLGVSKVINCGCDLKSSVESIKLSQKYDYFYSAVGIHPHEAEDSSYEQLEEIQKLAQSKKCVAIGEIGLDYHYDFSPRDIQQEFFKKQIIIAKELDMPIIVHDREAHEDTLALLKKYRPKGVVHCYSGSAESAKEIIKLGMYIGFGGAVTFKNARKPIETAASIPLDRLLLETDCPYMAPVPFRGKKCTSDLIEFAAQKIAEVRNMQTQDIIDIAAENACELFKIQTE
ncbi:MAG: TatD family hydrolase [Clostridia bacterium]|nr:TatD family hydrolase [Clostridia bacterium]